MKQQEINKLLDQYRLGTISESDRQKLEQLSIADDFVFTALEGINNEMSSKKESISMDGLRNKLLERVETKKTRRLPVWIPSVAAAILLIVGGLWLFNPTSDLGNDPVFADASKAKEAKDIEFTEDEASNETIELKNETITQSEVVNTTNQSDDREQEKKIVVTQKENSGATKPPVKIIPPPAVVDEKYSDTDQGGDFANRPSQSIPKDYDDVFAEEEIMEEMDSDVLQGDLNTEYSPERKSSAPVSAKAKKQQPTMERFDGASAQVENESNRSPIYKGIITDQYNEPLIGVSIVVLGTDKGYITDYDGKVEISDVFIDKPRALVSYTGFKSIEIPLREEFTVQMQEGALLSEVVVVGNGIAGISSPEMGWDKFNSLVESSLISQNASSNIQLDFTVGQNGVPSDFKIIKGKDSPLTPMLINLIKTSGKWSPGSGTYVY